MHPEKVDSAWRPELRETVVRLVRSDEQPRYQELMREHHYLGHLPKIGETLWYVASWREQWVALLSFSASALKCAPRDGWIGWTLRQHYGRLKLVVNNSRFLILPDWHLFNWGSRLLALCQRRLGRDWEEAFGRALRAVQLDTLNRQVYTTEFLDGPESIQRGGTSMDKKRLDYYKKKLVTRREELMKTIARTQEEGRTADEDPTVDLADKAANSYTKEFLFGMTNTDRTILNMIDAALKRINTDEYGVCANCQEEMQQKRLEAVPWAKHCISCQEKMEQGLL